VILSEAVAAVEQRPESSEFYIRDGLFVEHI